jgi:DNA mismatch endonuclease (patch repair protein)
VRLDQPTQQTRKRMRAVRGRDTAPEVALRKALHGRGLRFRVDVPIIAGSRRRADIVFSRARLAVFVDGCFWHACPQHATIPKTNREWWERKLAANVARDRDSDRLLAEEGWQVIRVWAHEDAEIAAEAIKWQYLSRLELHY